MAKNSRNSTRQLRIIGGQWRSRRFQFPDIAAIRPTADKLRETLFNWLQFDIQGTTCLDLFAGSGALGLEALSRGATQVHFVERNLRAAQALQQHLDLLQAPQAHVHTCQAQQFLQKNTQAFDIIFIDPPFHTDLLEKTMSQLLTSSAVHAGTLFFIETEHATFPLQLTVQKQSQSGQSHGWLAIQ